MKESWFEAKVLNVGDFVRKDDGADAGKIYQVIATGEHIINNEKLICITEVLNAQDIEELLNGDVELDEDNFKFIPLNRFFEKLTTVEFSPPEHIMEML